MGEDQSAVPEASGGSARTSNAYDMFILVLTVLSLAIMVVLVLPVSDATIQLLTVYDNVICVVFLIDFSWNLSRARPKREYLIGRRGWLDLIGSIPSFGFLGVFRFTALFRLARLSRLARITRLLRGQNKAALIRDVVEHRGQYAAFITILAAMTVLTITSVLVLQFESRSPDANITSGGDALWWAIVTITTVGYGDRFPVTGAGRITAIFVMFAGIGIIGALASILASVLVPTPEEAAEPETAPAGEPTVQQQLADIKQELAEIRRSMPDGGSEPPEP
ncbi:MAG TPA: ion transporter [Actinomycetota bacterium]|jgi:voltage-gated potassium channel|nr:ion transporter [Actinomycetota bacterium]